jgi:hypothetical protein
MQPEEPASRTSKTARRRLEITSKTWQVNTGWVLAANLAADLVAWTRLLGHYDDKELANAAPDTLRYRIWHLPARLASHARQRTLAIAASWPWETRLPHLLAAAHRPASTHLTSTSSPNDRKEDHPGAVGAGANPGTPGAPRTTRPEGKQT